MLGKLQQPGVFCLSGAHGEDIGHGFGRSRSMTTLSWNDELSCAKHFCKMCVSAHKTLQSHRVRNPGAVHLTPMLRALSLGRSVFMKLESEQVTNSFKVRGAINCVLKSRAKHIVTASTGNHALAVMHAVNLLGLEATIFIPLSTSRNKIGALQRFAEGGRCAIHLVGSECLQAELAAAEFAKQHEAFYVSPYNDELVIAGQGTIGVEIIEYFAKSCPSFAGRQKCCYITVGGGALITGIASVLKASQPGQWRIVGCLPQNSAVMFECIKAGRVVEAHCRETLSDGSAGQIEQTTITYEACSHLVDAWAIVSEEDIKRAMCDVLMSEHKLLEGAAGVAVAGLRRDSEWRNANNCVASVVIACGGNVGIDVIRKIINAGR